MKLVVLAGAKKGATVPLKKDRFTIGRSKECSLRAGSDAISRRHCELKLTDKGVTARDMGSRNGTYVNETKIEGEQLLASGDTLRIGPLEFRFESDAAVSKVKQPKVKSVGEAVARSAGKARSDSDQPIEDSISDWLLGEPETGEAPSIGETLTMRTDETRQIAEELAKQDNAETAEMAPSEEEAEAEEPEEDDAKGKKKKKKEPGKLPFRPPENQAKDSREAAMNVLRDMARRR